MKDMDSPPSSTSRPASRRDSTSSTEDSFIQPATTRMTKNQKIGPTACRRIIAGTVVGRNAILVPSVNAMGRKRCGRSLMSIMMSARGRNDPAIDNPSNT